VARILRGDIRWADLNPVRGSEQGGIVFAIANRGHPVHADAELSAQKVHGAGFLCIRVTKVQNSRFRHLRCERRCHRRSPLVQETFPDGLDPSRFGSAKVQEFLDAQVRTVKDIFGDDLDHFTVAFDQPIIGRVGRTQNAISGEQYDSHLFLPSEIDQHFQRFRRKCQPQETLPRRRVDHFRAVVTDLRSPQSEFMNPLTDRRIHSAGCQRNAESGIVGFANSGFNRRSHSLVRGQKRSIHVENEEMWSGIVHNASFESDRAVSCRLRQESRGLSM